MSFYTEQELNAVAGGGFLCGVAFAITLQIVTNLILDGIDAILAWRRRKREALP